MIDHCKYKLQQDDPTFWVFADVVYEQKIHVKSTVYAEFCYLIYLVTI